MVTEKVPFPSAPSGVAGLILLWRQRIQISSRALVGSFSVVSLFLISVFCATKLSWLPRRTNGLIQLIYSIVIGYALFMTVTQASRRQIANLFLGFALVILVGCLLKLYVACDRSATRSARSFTARASTTTICGTRFFTAAPGRSSSHRSLPASPSATRCSAFRLVVSTWRWKLGVCVGLFAAGLSAMPGPTLLLMLLLILPYLLVLASRRNGRLDVGRFLVVALAAIVFLGAFIVLARQCFLIGWSR